MFRQIHNRYRITIVLVSVVALASLAFTRSDLYRQIAHSQRMINEVYKHLITNYVDEIDTESFTRSSIRKITADLDPYTVYLEAEERDGIDLLTHGKYGGVGIQLGRRNGHLTVIAPMDDTPAQRAGILSGDIITRIDAVDAAELSIDEAAKRIRGLRGTTVILTISRYGTEQELEFSLTRAEIQIKDVTYSGLITPTTAYVRLSRFSKNSAWEMNRALQDLEQRGMRELILDLRDNPGGLLNSAIDILDLFIPKNELLLTTRGRTKESNKTFHARRDAFLPADLKMAVLINNGSASASEIVAGAIQDLDRGVVVGQRSFGKGLVQSVYALDESRSLKVTTAKYYIPSGRLIQKSDYVDTSLVTLTQPTDSLFTTVGGRIVTGGGGIRPDHQVELVPLTPLTLECWRRGLLFAFAQQHKHEYGTLDEVLADGELLTRFKRYLDQQDLEVPLPGEADFRAAREKITLRDSTDQELQTALETIAEFIHREQESLFDKDQLQLAERLYLEFAALLGGTEGRIEYILGIDPVVAKALGILSDQVAYQDTFVVPQ